MSKILLVPIGRADVPPREISPRLRTQLNYFIGSPSAAGHPKLAELEFWFDPVEVDKWIDDGVFYLVSPLDTANMTEVELSEEQESLLAWLKSHQIQHLRVIE